MYGTTLGITNDRRGWTAWTPVLVSGKPGMPRATNAFFSRDPLELVTDELRAQDAMRESGTGAAIPPELTPRCLYHSPSLSEYWYPDQTFGTIADVDIQAQYRGASVIGTDICHCHLDGSGKSGRIVKVWHY